MSEGESRILKKERKTPCRL